MLKTKIKMAPRQGKARRKSQTVPDQSLSIDEIVRRYTRGISIDVENKTPIYVEQSEHDLEKLSRMSFSDKAALAADMKADQERVIREAEERASLRASEEAEAKKRSEASAQHSKSLDNTVLDDTKAKKPVS